MHRVGMFYRFGYNGVSGLMKGNDFFLLRIHNPGLFLQSPHHPVDGLVQIRQFDHFFAFPGGQQGGLIDQVGQVGPHKTRGAAGDLAEIDIGT